MSASTGPTGHLRLPEKFRLQGFLPCMLHALLGLRPQLASVDLSAVAAVFAAAMLRRPVSEGSRD